MILTRLLVIVVASAGLVAALDGGGQGPGAALAADALVRERAATAAAALARLDASIAPGLDAAREGSARVVAGDRPPGESLDEAAGALRDAVPSAVEAERALVALDAAQRARDPAASPVPLVADAAEIGSIADQLAGAVDAADAFAAMRGRAERLAERLAAALRAMEADDLPTARELLETARADHRELEAWTIGLLTLPVWLDTTGELLDAVEALLAAIESGDADAVEAAAARVTALDEEAASADRALRIAMAEGGASVTAAPLGRLASALAGLADARARVASILQAVGR